MSKKRNVKNLEKGRIQGRELLGEIASNLTESVKTDSVLPSGEKTSLILKYKYLVKNKKTPAWYLKPNWRVPMIVGVFTGGKKQRLVNYVTTRYTNWRAIDKAKFESELFEQAQESTPIRVILKGSTTRKAIRRLNVKCDDRIAFSCKLKITNVDLEELEIGFSGVELFDTVYPDQTKLSTLQNKIARLANKAIQGQQHTFTNTKVIPRIYESERKVMEKIFTAYGGTVIDSDKIYQSLARLCGLAGYFDGEIPNSVGICREIIENSKSSAKELEDKRFLKNLQSLNSHFIDSGVLSLMDKQDIKTVYLFLEFRYLPKQKEE